MSQQYIVENYIFNKTTKTITFPNLQKIKQEGILLITNVTTGTVIYQFNKNGFGGTLSGNTLTLVFNTSAMNNSDILQIIYNPPSGGFFDNTTGILIRILEYIRSPTTLVKLLSGDAFRVVFDGNSSLNTVNGVTNLTNFNGMDTRLLHWRSWDTEYNTGIRSRIL